MQEFTPEQKRRMHALICRVGMTDSEADERMAEFLYELGRQGFEVEQVMELMEFMENLINRTGGRP